MLPGLPAWRGGLANAIPDSLVVWPAYWGPCRSLGEAKGGL